VLANVQMMERSQRMALREMLRMMSDVIVIGPVTCMNGRGLNLIGMIDSQFVTEQ
jgi:hypothetical protein